MTDSPVPLAAHHHPDLSIDQQLALRTASTRLHDDFSEHFGVETIERFLHSSYDQFAGRATVPNFLPLLAERWARQRLTALARVEGKITDAKPTVLFLCTHNAGRSQMALGFFNHLAGDQGVAWSGGSEPGNEINPSAVQAMAEVGIDITREFPKPWTDEIVQAADVVVTMGCGDACPFFPGKRYENWELPDPAGQSVDAVRPIRDDIEERVRRLLDELGITPVDLMSETDRTPSVLFVCVKNGGKSQMAAGLMSKIAGDTVQVYSAGTKPGTAVNDLSAQALAEVGVDITGNTPTLIDPHLVRDVDLVVTLGREARRRPSARHPVRELGHRRTVRARHRRHRAHAPGPRRHRRPRRRSPYPHGG